MHPNTPIQKLSFDEICALEGLSRSGLYKLMKRDPSFPRPVKDGAARSARVKFVAAEFAEWQQSKLIARSTPCPAEEL